MKIKLLLFAISISGAAVAQTPKTATKANNAGPIPLQKIEAFSPGSEVKIFDQDGVSIFARERKTRMGDLGITKSAIISRVVNANTKGVSMTMDYIDGGKNKKSGGRFGVNSTEGCFICGYQVLAASTTYNDTSKPEDVTRSIGFEFAIEDISQVKIINAHIQLLPDPPPPPIPGAPKYGWVVSTYQRYTGGTPPPIYHTVSKVLDLSTLDISSVRKKRDDGTARTAVEIYAEALEKWFLSRLRAHHINNAVDISTAQGGVSAYVVRYDNAARREHPIITKSDAEDQRQHVIRSEFVATSFYTTPQHVDYLNDDLTETPQTPVAAKTGSPANNDVSRPGNVAVNTQGINNVSNSNGISGSSYNNSNSNTKTNNNPPANSTAGITAARAAGANTNAATPSGNTGVSATPPAAVRWPLPSTPSSTPDRHNYTRDEITAVWNFRMTWPSAPGLGSLTGKITFRVGDNGTVKGSIVADPGQRIPINDNFENGILNGDGIALKIQTPVAEIQQWYNLNIISRTKMKGIIKNVAVKPTNRPANWDIPAEIELSR